MDDKARALKELMDKTIGIKGEIVVDKVGELGLVYRSVSGIVLYSAELCRESGEEEWGLWGFGSLSLEDMRRILKKL